ncbi:MAG: hypothetical protein ABIG66_02400 [Candidatus Kerfeldbacteria bacterium]
MTIRSEQPFIFKEYNFDHGTNTATFTYSYGNELTFTETLEFPAETVALDNNPEVFKRLLFCLHLILGISYWKAYCPKKIEVESGMLTREQADFWNTVYTKGLGEFFYKNEIDFRGLVQFPATATVALDPHAASVDDTSLVPLGGGKDSLLTITLLKQLEKPFSTFALGSHEIIEQQAERIGEEHFIVKRTIDPKLLALNKQDAYNGHVPVSAIYAFTALATAALTGNRYVIVSNEHSSNEGNVQYLGETINHQWSKSYEFEQLLRGYVTTYITPDIEYFSLLRPLHEIQIAKLFSEYAAEWLPRFTSCNRNFRLEERAESLWCCQCPKCAFVFLMLAPFMPKQDLIKAFGNNPLDDESLIPVYEELLGVKDHKPFDCVGTPEEVRVAFSMLGDVENFDNDAVMTHVRTLSSVSLDDVEDVRKAVFSVSDEHALPDEFLTTFDAIELSQQ